MARPRTQLTPEIEAQIRARMARGESARTIWQLTRKPCSLSTIERRIDAFKAKVARRPAKAPPTPAGTAHDRIADILIAYAEAQPDPHAAARQIAADLAALEAGNAAASVQP